MPSICYMVGLGFRVWGLRVQGLGYSGNNGGQKGRVYQQTQNKHKISAEPQTPKLKPCTDPRLVQFSGQPKVNLMGFIGFIV